jgi:hypothetical protein
MLAGLVWHPYALFGIPMLAGFVWHPYVCVVFLRAGRKKGQNLIKHQITLRNTYKTLMLRGYNHGASLEESEKKQRAQRREVRVQEWWDE